MLCMGSADLTTLQGLEVGKVRTLSEAWADPEVQACMPDVVRERYEAGQGLDLDDSPASAAQVSVRLVLLAQAPCAPRLHAVHIWA